MKSPLNLSLKITPEKQKQKTRIGPNLISPKPSLSTPQYKKMH